MRLFHFSDDPGIALFSPRPVRVPSSRPAGRDWLNGPLVWAIDETHAMLYLFPRDCPRIVVWPVATTSPDERAQWFGDQPWRAIAHVERDWLERLRTATLYRYDLPVAAFAPLGDVGMWVARAAVAPLRVEAIRDLPAALEAGGVALRVMETLTPLAEVWNTSLHASGLRLRNARDWVQPSPGSNMPTRAR